MSDESDNSFDESNNDINRTLQISAKSVNTTDSSFHNSITACNDENMLVHYAEPKGGNKKNFCLYCKTFQSKIARHLEFVHKNEEDVKKFILLPKGS